MQEQIFTVKIDTPFKLAEAIESLRFYFEHCRRIKQPVTMKLLSSNFFIDTLTKEKHEREGQRIEAAP